MKGVKITSVVFSFVLSLAATFFFAFSAIEHNAQEEYCAVIGYVSTHPASDKETFVKTNNATFVPYTQAVAGEQIFYIRHSASEYNFEDANWQSQNRLCKLKKDAYALIAGVFASAFFVLFVLTFLVLMMIHLLLGMIKQHKTQ